MVVTVRPLDELQQKAAVIYVIRILLISAGTVVAVRPPDEVLATQKDTPAPCTHTPRP